MEYPNMTINATRTKVSTVIGPKLLRGSISIDDWKWFLDELRKIPPGQDFVIQTKEGDRDLELRICNRDSGTKTL